MSALLHALPLPPCRCLITGCRYVDEPERRHVWGDLHAAGSALIFASTLDDRGETRWSYDWPPPDTAYERQVGAVPAFQFFERRGVIVWDKWNSWFNATAKDFLLRERQSR